MAKHYHEIRDPIHVFIRLTNPERAIVDSRPFQRLRSIHQLAMTYLVYPGATHRRFEHSLLGPEKSAQLPGKPIRGFSSLETILSEIIVGDAFGVDRMDYLLRDSHHLGVAYGRFDHYRLIDTLRILPSAPPCNDPDPRLEETMIPRLGIEEGGIQSSEALMLARYFMYSQVYFHRVRRIYDIHLKDFLSAWLPGGKFSTNLEDHLRLTDCHVSAAMLDSSRESGTGTGALARRVIHREHFRVLYERNPNDVKVNPKAGTAIFQAALGKFGADHIRHDPYVQKSGIPNFPVLLRDKRIVTAETESETLRTLPVVAVDYVFASKQVFPEAKKWLEDKRPEIIQQKEGG